MGHFSNIISVGFYFIRASWTRNLSAKFISSKWGISFAPTRKFLCGFSLISRHLFSESQLFVTTIQNKVAHLNPSSASFLFFCHFKPESVTICSIRDPTNFEQWLSEFNWRACQLICSLNIHHKHIRQYHLLSIASFRSTRFIKDLHQTLTSVRYPHKLKRTHLHTYTYLHTHLSEHTLTYTHM